MFPGVDEDSYDIKKSCEGKTFESASIKIIIIILARVTTADISIQALITLSQNLVGALSVFSYTTYGHVLAVCKPQEKPALLYRE